jgi:hypothetical protein
VIAQPAAAKTQSSPAGWLAAGCAGFVMLLALVCLGSAALAASQPAGQALLFKPFVLRAGDFGLSAAVSGTPDCPPEIVDCSVPIMPGQMYASLWFSIRTIRAGTVTLAYRPLLRLRLR